MYKHLCIVGCGLIGGSFALSARRAGAVERITVCGGKRSPKLAVERGVADAIEESFDRGEICQADLIYLAAPIGGVIDFLRTRGGQLKPGAVVTDAGSTKAEIVRVARLSLPDQVHFIAGHPMAGGEYTGVEYARADLFERAIYALISTPETDAAELDRFKALVESTGARVILTDAQSHDAAVALISHTPQLTASALASLLGAEYEDDLDDRALAQTLAARGWRDMTRLAGSSWSVWRDICMTNQVNISRSLGDLIQELQSLKDALDAHDYNRVRQLFSSANASVEEQRALHYSHFQKL